MEIQSATSKIIQRTFTTRSAYRDAIPWLEKLSLSDRIVNFRFEDVEEAFFADLLAGFGTFEDCAGFSAEGAEFGSHGGPIAVARGFGESDRAEEPGKSSGHDSERPEDFDLEYL